MSDWLAVWLTLVARRKTENCACGECLLAGVDRPPIELRATKKHPSRWLHGRDLRRFYEMEDAAGANRHELAERLQQDHLARVANRITKSTSLRAQRGDEPR